MSAAYVQVNGKFVSKGKFESMVKRGQIANEPPEIRLGVPVIEKKPKRLRQSSKPLLNKLETEWFNVIKDQYPNYPAIRPQAKTYKIANGLRYTPDFTVSSWPRAVGPATETAWEVKGKWVDGDSFPKLKMAAAAWPEVRFILVWKQDGEWKEQVILP